jgi:SAM-dependent methyltransferase
MLMTCPACTTSTPHRRLFSKNSCDILKCADCGLGRAEPSDFDITTYYTEDYFSGGRTDGYADYQGSEPILRREFARTVGFIRNFRATGRLLEIGCAYGFFLKEASSFYDAAGIEIAEAAAKSCRDQGLKVVTGAVDEANLSRLGGMDVIVLLDVVEHLPEPWSTLALCRRYLNPGGIIVISTGDFASFYARVAGQHWRLMTPPQHLWYFTPESLRRIALSLNLQMESCEHPWKLVPLSLMIFQMRRLLGSYQGPAISTGRIGIPVNLFDAMRCVLRKPMSDPSG